MSYGPTDSGVSKVIGYVAMDFTIFNTDVSKVMGYVAMDYAPPPPPGGSNQVTVMCVT